MFLAPSLDMYLMQARSGFLAFYTFDLGHIFLTAANLILVSFLMNMCMWYVPVVGASSSAKIMKSTFLSCTTVLHLRIS